MATITGGELAGMSRPAALEFSFFLSMPTMAAATLYDLLRSLRSPGGGAGAAMPHDAHAWAVLGLGFVVSFAVAYAVVAWFMAWVRAHGFIPFALYRIIAGARRPLPRHHPPPLANRRAPRPQHAPPTEVKALPELPFPMLVGVTRARPAPRHAFPPGGVGGGGTGSPAVPLASIA